MKKLKYGLWDNDGLLFPYSPELKETFRKAACIAVRSVVDPDLSEKEICEILNRSKKKYGDTYAGLVAQGYDEEELNRIHFANLDHKLIKPDLKVIEEFRKSLREGMKHGMLTHGMSEWVSRVMPRVGLSFVFREANRITADKNGFSKKHRNPDMFRKALRDLKFPADQTFFVEDTAVNLKFAHKAGMYTILVHRGQEMENCPDYINHQCEDIPAVFAQVRSFNVS
jgi:FMN phosphatase YigB (HAD superfamily)